MLFNSIEFLIFLPVVFILYWFVFSFSHKAQNILILLSSYLFYGWWDWRFLFLIFFSSIVDFFLGLRLENTVNEKKRKFFLFLSISVNLGLLIFFKYSNFFIDSFRSAFLFFGKPIDLMTLKIILPVGISFYTFQTLSYTIDVYKKKLKPTNDIVNFFAYVSFFPQLVAGPIERAINLLPQFSSKRVFKENIAVDGMRQILWGLFKKIVIADNCAVFANQIFDNYEIFNGSTLFIGAVFFAFQIYGDFSGYSDIAIGTSKLFGFNLMQNFAFPYFSRDIAEFWRRWHISLSTWFRDYVYIPLGGSKLGVVGKVRNTFIIFIISGFWHGANWTYVAWGFINACYFLPLLLAKSNRRNLDVVAEGKMFPSIYEFLQMIMTFCLVVFGWIFFRAETIAEAIDYISKMISFSLFKLPLKFLENRESLQTFGLLLFFISVEWLGREKKYAIENIFMGNHFILRWFSYFVILFFIYFFGNFSESIEFIYFKF